MISLYSNTLGQEEVEAIRNVLGSRWLGMGKECRSFEKELAERWRVDGVLLTNNCTSAIYIALRTLDIEGGEVIISTINFVACANAVIELGATPIFADVDENTLNILPSEIERLKTDKTKAVIILHYGGHPARFDEIKTACGDIPIIEDSANSVMSLYKGRYCGTLGYAGVFSFDAMKILAMGDGGALIINNELAKSLRYLGYSSDTVSGTDSSKQGDERWWEFKVEHPSGRFISNDILASIGRIQLKKVDGFIRRRKEIWEMYQKELEGVVLPPEPYPETTSSYYMYWIKTDRRDELARYLANKHIYTTFRYYPLHLVFGDERLENAERINETTLNIPLHQNLSDADVAYIVGKIKEFK